MNGNANCKFCVYPVGPVNILKFGSPNLPKRKESGFPGANFFKSCPHFRRSCKVKTKSQKLFPFIKVAEDPAGIP